MISRRQVADLNKNMKAFKKKNAQLVVIGNGPEHFITPFREATGYKGPLFTDPSLETYKILDFKKGLTSVIGLDPLKAGIRALSTGFWQKGIQGPPLQQGGVLVVISHTMSIAVRKPGTIHQRKRYSKLVRCNTHCRVMI